jgi:hypothetical protein
MALDSFPFLKMKPMYDSPIVCVPFLDIGMSGCKMSRQEAKTGIVMVKSYSNGALISGHASQARLTQLVRLMVTNYAKEFLPFVMPLPHF